MNSPSRLLSQGPFMVSRAGGMPSKRGCFECVLASRVSQSCESNAGDREHFVKN